MLPIDQFQMNVQIQQKKILWSLNLAWYGPGTAGGFQNSVDISIIRWLREVRKKKIITLQYMYHFDILLYSACEFESTILDNDIILFV